MTIEVSKYNDSKNFSGICWPVVSDHTRQVSIFCDNICSFFNSYDWGVFGTIVTKLWTLWEWDLSAGLALPHGGMFCYPRSRSVKTWGNSILFLFQFCNFPTLLNLMRITGLKWTKMARNSEFSALNSAKLKGNVGKVKLHLNYFKHQQSGFVYSKT